MPAPVASKRKYVHVATYQDFTIGTYLSPEPIYKVGDCPVYCVYYVLDDCGDPLLPVDLPVWTPAIAYALIDVFVSLSDADRDLWWRQRGPWRLLHQNYRMQQFLPGIAEVLRRLYVEAKDDGLDVFYTDASEFAAHVVSMLKPVFAAIDGAGPVPAHMRLAYNNNEGEDDGLAGL